MVYQKLTYAGDLTARLRTSCYITVRLQIHGFYLTVR